MASTDMAWSKTRQQTRVTGEEMTTALEIFFENIRKENPEYTGYDVLRAFVQEINRREDECDNSGLGCPYESRSQCRGDKLRSVVREFGLDGEGK